MDIIKKSNGQVWLVQSGNLEKILPATAIVEVKSEREIIVKQGMNQFTSIFVSEIDNYQIEPASPIAFSGNVYDLMLILSDFFFELSGGGGGDDLETVLANGNSSGNNDIVFFAFQGLQYGNNSRLREGTIDAGLGGFKGIAEICGAGFESKWEGGVRYIMGSSGNTIRQSLYNFANTPTSADDVTKGYQIGSLWTLDDGTVYNCIDATSGAAVWKLQSNAVPNLSQVLASGNSANNLAIIDLRNLDFATSVGHTVAEGELAWNDTDGTLDLGLKGGLKNKVGQQLVVRARNTSGSLISKGSVVKVVGVAGGFIGINLAKADNDTNSATAFGIVAEDIADSSNGFVTINGIVHGVNTNAFTEGDILYLSSTVAGEITNVKPVSPAHVVVVGYCAKKSTTDGHILLHVQNGYELDELHDVSITSAANGDSLEYNGTLWVNKGIVYTVELVDALTVNFYAPYNMKINTISNILNSPTITIQDDGAAYTLTNTIASGSKITVTANTASVVNLNITKA